MPDEGSREQWYTNKELFEMVQGLKDDLRDTRVVVKKYNGLRSDVNWCMEQLTTTQGITTGKDLVLQAIREWGGWIVTIILLILKFTGGG